MLALLIDFESTGVDTSKDRIIEIGAQVVDKNWEVQKEFSLLVRPEAGLPLSEEVKKVTHLTDDLLAEAMALKEVIGLFEGFCSLRDLSYVIAFNRLFDEALFKTEMIRHSLAHGPIAHVMGTPWLCAMADIETNYVYKSWRLAHLALEYGVTVNPKELHRAVNDVELMRKLLIAAGKTPQQMYTFQTIPWVFVRALIPVPWEDGGKGRDEAKKLGYSWEIAKGSDGPKFEKAWVKRIKAHMVDEEIKQAPFKVRQIKETS